MQAFIAGATNVVMRMFVSQEALEQIEKVGVTTTFAAPAMLAMILAEPGATRDSFKTMRKLVYGGSPISEPLLKQCMDMIDCDFLQIYASTETGNVAACLPPFDHVPGSPRLKAAGRAYPGVELKVVDREGKEVPAGELGEVCVHTPAHMIGYWNKPEETETTLVDGWIHTGDAGYLDDDGYLYLGDRIKDLIIVAGQNVYPAEVEAAVARHPAVAEVAVIGVPDERWGEAIRACVVLRAGEEATPRQLTLAAREHLADFKIPSQWDFVTGLPRNPAGKILRRILRDKFWEHMERKVN
jgi:fatty-acyl-CoA synthase/long-chain acyl-CoA synthetase